ncbi:hypothetical protein C8Q74DRAFT_1233612 [Fomes fomentarius]|nr:hypothetical protein C8Q74DRAFT_1233612 [Fomes fomentarius]
MPRALLLLGHSYSPKQPLKTRLGFQASPCTRRNCGFSRGMLSSGQSYFSSFVVTYCILTPRTQNPKRLHRLIPFLEAIAPDPIKSLSCYRYPAVKLNPLLPSPTSPQSHSTMFFNSLTVFATIAFSAFTSAIPLANEQAGVISPKDVVFPVAPANGVVTGDVLPRAGLDSIVSILTDMHVQLVPVTAPLKFVTANNATFDAVSPSLDHIKSILNNGIARLKALSGQPRSVLLASPFKNDAELISITDLGSLLATVTTAITVPLGTVVALDGLLVPPLAAILTDVGALVGALLAAVLSLVNVLVAALPPTLTSLLTPLVTRDVATTRAVGATQLLSLLGL